MVSTGVKIFLFIFILIIITVPLIYLIFYYTSKCKNSTDCSPGYYCLDGECTVGQCNGTTGCTGDLVCVDGFCVSTAGCVDCANPSNCPSGLCDGNYCAFGIASPVNFTVANATYAFSTQINGATYYLNIDEKGSNFVLNSRPTEYSFSYNPTTQILAFASTKAPWAGNYVGIAGNGHLAITTAPRNTFIYGTANLLWTDCGQALYYANSTASTTLAYFPKTVPGAVACLCPETWKDGTNATPASLKITVFTN